MSLTSEAKKLLAETIRSLRDKLLLAIHDEAERRYRLSVPLRKAGLDEAHTKRRERIEAWLDEQARAQKTSKKEKDLKATKERLLAQAEKEAAATLINRLVLLRQLEAAGLSKPQVVTGGWNSKGYREFRDFAPTLCTNGTTDATEGYATLLGLLFDELSVELPGLYGDVGLTKLFAIPAATLREVVERLDAPELASAWTDDTTLGWVYQYWNDPDREALDAKINGGGKIEPHEIASKTQMFTERYMVEWLLQNSLGLTWLAMCKQHGWKADAERVLPVLDARRAEWRQKRDAGEVALDALMPIEKGLEDRWKYYVPQPIPDDAVQQAPASVRAIKLLDPACGSGHFLVIAFGLLAALYEEEARHLELEEMTPRGIAESILENNLHGIDIDPRAIQIAAAGLYLKCRTFAKDARPKLLNLVAPALALGNLPTDDPAVVQLREDLREEAGIPQELTDQLLKALAGVDHLGSLLKVDAAVEEALRDVELEFERKHGQGDLFDGFPAQQVKLTVAEAKSTVLQTLERFLVRHSRSEDLGLRLDGEQLASGVRFVRLAKGGAYDLVVGNPPYQGLSKTEAFGYVTTRYPKGKADLYAAFLERALQLTRPGGISALLTMRGWMFLGQFTELRTHLLHYNDLCCIGDVDRGAFEDVPDEVLSTVMSVFCNAMPNNQAVALQPTPPSDRARDANRTARKRAAVLAQVGRHEFDPRGFEVIEGEPIVYWWTKDFLCEYNRHTKFGETYVSRAGMATQDNPRYVRMAWEVSPLGDLSCKRLGWVSFVTGGKGREWIEPVTTVLKWHSSGLEMKVRHEYAYRSLTKYIPSESKYFQIGVSFCTTGSEFSARVYRAPSVFSNVGSTVFAGEDNHYVLCLFNSTRVRQLLASLNPSIHFELSDIKRIPLWPVDNASQIFGRIQAAFGQHETTREPSIEFKEPGHSPWSYVQSWAQRAIDRCAGEMLPPYEPTEESPTFLDKVSFTVGIALGRFDPNGTGILHVAPPNALPGGILFVSSEGADSLEHLACRRLMAEFQSDAHNCLEPAGSTPSEYLRKDFFGHHSRLYQKRPIYFPLSSAKKNFVAFASIHRWQDDTLNVLLADHLVPTRRRLEGELDDLRSSRATGTNKGKSERRFTEVQKLLEELNDFIAKVTDIAENGPPPSDEKTQKREVNAKYTMDLDDGVRVNSAALWPLLEPQWKDPKKWWKELANAQGKKDYDWSHLAARYFPTRVRAKCHEDPSLAVAHKCFWELHPAKAYAWELRLQDEIKPDFTIDEPGSDEARAMFLSEHEAEAKAIHAAELKRRKKKAAKQDADQEIEQLPLESSDDDNFAEGEDE